LSGDDIISEIKLDAAAGRGQLLRMRQRKENEGFYL
jgi:hypothetical protein